MRPKHLAKVAAKSVFALADPLFGPFPGPRILIYHQVGVDLGREMEVPTEAFHRQLDWMQSRGEIVDLETAIERRSAPDANKLFVLTFDDGFEDVYLNAFPIMKDRRVPFTLYLTTNPIEACRPLDPRYPAAKPLTWDQVNEMIGTGLVTIGAHTHTHPDLRTIDEDRIVEELDHSNRIIADRTGIEPRHFTYPWGWSSAEAASPVHATYDTATVGSGPPITASSDLHNLHRIPIQRSDVGVLFRWKLRTGGPFEHQVRSRLGRQGPFQRSVSPGGDLTAPRPAEEYNLSADKGGSQDWIHPVLEATAADVYVIAGSEGWLRRVSEAIEGDLRTAVGVENVLARRLIRSRSSSALAAGDTERELKRIGLRPDRRFAVWPSPENPRLIYESPLTGFWLQRAGIIGGGGRSTVKRWLARSLLASPVVALLNPSSVWIIGR